MPDRDVAPLVPGLTETIDDGKDLRQRLLDAMARRPGASTEFVANALGELEQAFKMEASPEMKARVAAAMTLLRQGPPRPGDFDQSTDDLPG